MAVAGLITPSMAAPSTRQLEAVGVDLPGDVDVLGVPGPPARDDGDVVEPVGLTSRLEDADLDFSQCARPPAFVGPVRLTNHTGMSSRLIANAGPTRRRSSTLLSRVRASGRAWRTKLPVRGPVAVTCSAAAGAGCGAPAEEPRADLRQAGPMTDRRPHRHSSAAAVARGMQAQLARRDAALAAGAAAGGLEDRLQHARHPGALRADRRRRRLPGRHRGVARRGHSVAGRLGRPRRRGRGGHPGRRRRRQSPGWRRPSNWWTSTSPSTTSSRFWPATSATVGWSSATEVPGVDPWAMVAVA